MNNLDDFFQELGQNYRRLKLMQEKGLSYEDSMRILYGDTYDEAQEIIATVEENKANNEDLESEDHPAMHLKSESEPNQSNS